MHGNLVELVGWCHRRRRREYLLVYKFMPNRSLDKHLYDPADCMPWPRRYNIAMGLAAALRYLHHECQPNVVHRDVKPSNVMLDSNFNAKLGDFGMARKLDPGEEYRQTTLVTGTPFYVAPEYQRDWQKTDVYSFGIVALEIASGKSIQVDNHLVNWGRDLYDSGQIQTAADPRLNGQFDAEQMKRLLVVGLWCSYPDYVLRPTMQVAIPFLEGAPLRELPPARPSQEYRLYGGPSDEIFASALSNFTTGTAAIMPAPTASLNLAAPAPSSTTFFSTQLDD
ncbi:hypothetical protein ZIOFF_051593 [Zingiber officinale]|uniref:Protein kinase domain-containing protein n=1 Tax=Zingiber officinale TaxID=94328 RepID=A0A8J5FMA8_ZINOF|nr:hypothetical protein ZIOFF_051593 [Zingiber officinale]